ncbi:hypothetical protein ABE485_16155 [Achromobacter spanius]|uniref:hypothetical protein n=1 Tax=Achromobacter spanius TaxID=217203 RepID=UPI003207AE85
MTRLITVRLLWYAGVGAIALMSLFLHTQFGVAVLLSAIAIYIPLSILSLPLLAWLCLARPVREPGMPPAWPGCVAGVAGIALLASYQVLANLTLAECGFLLVLVAVDLLLARRETMQIWRIAQARSNS